MRVYKLTDQKHQTFNQTQWGENVTHETSGEGSLCGPGWLHFYYSPELAVLLNGIHVDFDSPVLWECEAGCRRKNDAGLKGGTTKLTSVRIVDLPVFTTIQKVAFGIYCALEVYKDSDFVIWAENWLSGKDRSARSAAAVAWSAESAARSVAWSAARSVAWSAESAARSVAWSAESAARSAAAAESAARSAAAWSAESAAAAAAAAAAAVAMNATDFSFLQRAAEKALKIS